MAGSGVRPAGPTCSEPSFAVTCPATAQSHLRVPHPSRFCDGWECKTLPGVSVVASSLLHPRNRHFDRSCSRLCEQRSGETRFSPQPSPQPRSCSCRCPLSPGNRSTTAPPHPTQAYPTHEPKPPSSPQGRTPPPHSSPSPATAPEHTTPSVAQHSISAPKPAHSTKAVPW